MPYLRLFTALLLTVPLWSQRQVPIDNEHVRVLVVTERPGRKGPLHEHPMNRVMIYLDAGHQKLTYEDGRVEDIQAKAGEVRWSSAGGKHTSESFGTPYRLVEIELKGTGHNTQPPVLDPVKIAPKLYSIVLDNPQVRVIRARVPAKTEIPLHEHGFNRVIVSVTDRQMRVTPENGTPSESTAKAGDVQWAGTARHSEENLGDSPFEVLAVELK
jgi:quercetin dioxygenase-like cupin family protein